MIKECYPPSDHFSEKGYLEAIKHMQKGDYRTACNHLGAAVLETAKPVCVNAFMSVITQTVVGCPKILSDALPMTWY